MEESSPHLPQEKRVLKKYLKYLFPAIFTLIIVILITYIYQKQNHTNQEPSFHSSNEEISLNPEIRLDLETKIPEPPQDKNTTFTLGEIKIETFTPVTITSLEESTNMYFHLTNQGKETITITDRQDSSPVPAPTETQFQHFFSLQDHEQIITPGETVIYEYIGAPENLSSEQEKIEFNQKFVFKNQETNQKTEISLPIIITHSPSMGEIPADAGLTGIVKNSKDQTLSDTEIVLNYYNGRNSLKVQTDHNGQFQFTTASVATLVQSMGSRPRPYSDLNYYLTIEKDGYEFYYQGNLELKREETKEIEITLLPQTENWDYQLIGEKETQGAYGYWWIYPLENFSSLSAVQARHPPQLDVAGHLININLSGEEQWRIETPNECWGMSVSADNLTAIACHEGTISIIDPDGKTLWSQNVGGQTRDITFSPDGTKILVGPYQTTTQKSDFALLETQTGKLLWQGSNYDEWLRHSIFSFDGQYLAVSLGGGRLLFYNIQGEKIWENFIGEFAMVLEIDEDNNIYSAGKNREMFSFDQEGNLRWRKAIGDHVVTAGSRNYSSETKQLIFGTVGAHLISLNTDGEFIWQRSLEGELQGHNALDITPNGKYLAVGTAGLGRGGYLTLYNQNGTKIWQKCEKDRREGTTPTYNYDHNQSGVITVAIDDYAEKIVAGYGDSTIRIFQKTE